MSVQPPVYTAQYCAVRRAMPSRSAPNELPAVARAPAAQWRREFRTRGFGPGLAMRLVQRHGAEYVRQMRRAVPKVGRPCTICCHRKHRQIAAALTAGTSQRAVSKSFKVSRSAIQRHQAGHLPPPVVRRSSIELYALYERSDGIAGEASDQPPSSPTQGPVEMSRVGWDLHPPYWRQSLGPRPGFCCAGCRGTSFWVEINGLFGGCRKCSPPMLGVITRNFET